MSYKLTRYERETIINFNEAEATAGVYTHNVAYLLLICVNLILQPALHRVKKLGSRTDVGQVGCKDVGLLNKSCVKLPEMIHITVAYRILNIV